MTLPTGIGQNSLKQALEIRDSFTSKAGIAGEQELVARLWKEAEAVAFSRNRSWFRLSLVVLVLGCFLGSLSSSPLGQKARRDSGTIPAAEFSRLIQEFSEQGGFFFSDNFISNETSYPYILSKFQELSLTGGAYIGVGPEQNFTYIAKIRPQIAFIVDIRRQAIIQHLMYKAIFHWAENRAQFLAWLFSKPAPGERMSGRQVSLEEMLAYFSHAPSPDETFTRNLAVLRKTIEKDFKFPLTDKDAQALDYVYSAFRQANLVISFQLGRMGFPARWGRGYPTLQDLLLATDSEGNHANFLASEDDYRFLRKLQRQNRIIPVVGDFSGNKALASVANYLRENDYEVTAFYTSNVEQYLFADQAFAGFAANIRKLPISANSVILRMVRTGWEPHPAYIPGHRMTPLLQKISVFLVDYDRNSFPDYWSLATKDYIAPNGTVPGHEPSSGERGP
ncbi:MAG: hypothetical protein HY648_02395 [Acidobacteria bacterium]|nr:hypothetical protein [Acidobacteriota bacterium]